MTFNDEVACRKEIGVTITGAVQATALLDILQKLDDPFLKVRENDRGELEFRGKKKGFGITKDAEIFLPIDRVEQPEKWKKLPADFTEAVGLVSLCVSGDESKFLLCCIHLHPDYVEACDNFQILRCKVDIGLEDSVLVRGTALKDITSLGMNKMSLTKSWIHFKNADGLIYSCRRYAESYPELDHLLKVKGHKIVLPKGAVKASDRAAVFAADASGQTQVQVNLVDGRMLIKGEGVFGWYKEVSKVAYEGPPMTFLISPELLQHISENYSEAVIQNDKLSAKGGHWTYTTVLSAAKEVEEDGDEDEEEEQPEKKSKKKKQGNNE